MPWTAPAPDWGRQLDLADPELRRDAASSEAPSASTVQSDSTRQAFTRLP